MERAGWHPYFWARRFEDEADLLLPHLRIGRVTAVPLRGLLHLAASVAYALSVPLFIAEGLLFFPLGFVGVLFGSLSPEGSFTSVADKIACDGLCALGAALTSIWRFTSFALRGTAGLLIECSSLALRVP